jgi:predicted ATP-dependent serine protease
MRYDFYHRKEERIPFDLEYLNRITKGGLPKKTLNVILAGTGVGKSLFMCHCAASHLSIGKNVLYITMEMAEERIAERIDANLLNVPLDELVLLPRDVYEKKIAKITEKTIGKLIIKEYPTASVGSANFRHLLNELRLKKKFVPDIIYIDYLNICASSRLKQGANVNSYTYIKAIAEELRGLAVEFNVPIVSATQTTRSGFTNSDVGLEDTSESFGLPATVDFMAAMITTDELQQLNQIMFKQLKNRYGDPTFMKRFVVGVDRPRMKLYDVEQSAQQGVMQDDPVFDKPGDSKFNREAFKGFS